MKKNTNQILILVAIAVLLGGCASAKKITNNPDKLVDDGKRNTVLFSYELVLDASEKHSVVSATNLQLRCRGTGKINTAPVCLDFTVPFKGLRTVSGYNMNTFEDEGAIAFQMKYGEYSIVKAGHSVIVDKWVERDCYRNKKGKLRCRNDTKYDRTKHSGNLPATTRFFVGPGAGCYAGHLKLHMSNSEISEYEWVSNIEDVNDDMISKLPQAIQGAVVTRVTGVCAG